MSFYAKVRTASQNNDSLLCVGLDPDLARIPDSFSKAEYPIFAFNQCIIDATADLVCAYKPQIAHYAAASAEDQLALTFDYLSTHYPDIPIILDAKRGDIGSTAQMYAREAFERYGADAVTVNPYLGGDSLEPFLDYTDKGVILLCRTSNPGSADLQMLSVNGKPLYQMLAEKAVCEWNTHNNIALVMGASDPEAIGAVRQVVGDMPLLIPGIGAQGGDLKAVLDQGLTAEGGGLLINASRSILYAASDTSCDQAARAEVLRLNTVIRSGRSAHS